MFLFLSVFMFALPDFSFYHTSEQIHAIVASLASSPASAYVRLDQCREPDQPDIPSVRFTSPHRSLSDVSSPRLSVLFNFGEHGRELISSEIALKLIELIQTNVADPFIAYLLRNVDLVIIPLLNSWSHQQVERGLVCTRKNKQGVDLNRNYDANFDHKHQFPPHSDQYAGSGPFSEFESRCVRDLGAALRPALYVNIHSGTKEVYYGRDDSPTPIANAGESGRLLKFVNRHYCNCPQGVAGAIGGYPVQGGSMDYFYDKYNTTYSYTLEVYGGQGPFEECFNFFNPPSRSGLDEVTGRWAESLLLAVYGLVQAKLGVPFIHNTPIWMKRHGQDNADTVPSLGELYSDAHSVLPSSTSSSVLSFHIPPLASPHYRVLLFAGYRAELDHQSAQTLIQWAKNLHRSRSAQSAGPSDEWPSDLPVQAEYIIVPAIFDEADYVLCQGTELDTAQEQRRAQRLDDFQSLVSRFRPDLSLMVSAAMGEQGKDEQNEKENKQEQLNEPGEEGAPADQDDEPLAPPSSSYSILYVHSDLLAAFRPLLGDERDDAAAPVDGQASGAADTPQGEFLKEIRSVDSADFSYPPSLVSWFSQAQLPHYYSLATVGPPARLPRSDMAEADAAPRFPREFYTSNRGLASCVPIVPLSSSQQSSDLSRVVAHFYALYEPASEPLEPHFMPATHSDRFNDGLTGAHTVLAWVTMGLLLLLWLATRRLPVNRQSADDGNQKSIRAKHAWFTGGRPGTADERMRAAVIGEII